MHFRPSNNIIVLLMAQSTSRDTLVFFGRWLDVMKVNIWITLHHTDDNVFWVRFAYGTIV